MQRNWVAAESAKAIEQFRAGKTTAQIVVALKDFGYERNPSQVRLHIYRALPNERRNRGQARRKEYARRRDEAFRLARAGMRTGEIAAKIGITEKWLKTIVPAAQRIDGYDFNFNRWLSKMQPDFIVEPDPVVSAGKSIVDIEQGECHWPIGVSADGARRFCSCQAVKGIRFEPYCAQHKETAKCRDVPRDEKWKPRNQPFRRWSRAIAINDKFDPIKAGT